jgi:hypothetical protein
MRILRILAIFELSGSAAGMVIALTAASWVLMALSVSIGWVGVRTWRRTPSTGVPRVGVRRLLLLATAFAAVIILATLPLWSHSKAAFTIGSYLLLVAMAAAVSISIQIGRENRMNKPPKAAT